MDEERNIHVVENFFGVYLLYCENPKFIGRTYIGYTVNPNRRIKQHNKGKHAGGAWRTSNKGPWKMVLIIHGFPNDVAALRFEWAWQHPDVSRRLKHIPKKKNNEKVFNYLLRLLSEMLRMGPWNRLPLTIRWLAQEYATEFPVTRLPPAHMPLCYGLVTSQKVAKTQNDQSGFETCDAELSLCSCCLELIQRKDQITCISPDCTLTAHLECLSQRFLQPGEYVPVEGECPRCGIQVLWGDLIRKYRGCYSSLTSVDCNEPEEAEVYSDIPSD